jgi:hypothetical protein
MISGMAISHAPDQVLPGTPGHVVLEIKIEGIAGLARFRPGSRVIFEIKLQRRVGPD